MSPLTEFYQQLTRRRVIRAALVYIAVFWLSIQVADLLADADIVGHNSVRWLIIVCLVGFPIVLALSWFFENPWHGRRWPAILGDVGIISAITITTYLLGWNYWLATFSRPIVAVIPIEATDTRQDTADLAHHFARRMRLLLATRPEIRVIETESSMQKNLRNLPIVEKARALNADLLLGGTINQGGNTIRLNIQLFSADGELLWSERYQDRLIDLGQMQDKVLSDLWPYLSISDEGLEEVRNLVMSCRYPIDSESILAIAYFDHADTVDPANLTDEITPFIERLTDSGLLHLARAKAYFKTMSLVDPIRRPVLQRLAMQDLKHAEIHCPGYPDIALARIYNTLELERSDLQPGLYLSRFPNEARLHMLLAERARVAGDLSRAATLAGEAVVLNNANLDNRCFYSELLQSTTGSGDQQQPNGTAEVCP